MSVTTHPDLEHALHAVRVAEEALTQKRAECDRHAAQKAEVRTNAIKHIFDTQTAPAGKPHSWSSAEALRDLHPTYAAFKQHETELAAERSEAETALWAAKLRAEYLARVLPPLEMKIRCAHGQLLGWRCPKCDDEHQRELAASTQRIEAMQAELEAGARLSAATTDPTYVHARRTA